MSRDALTPEWKLAFVAALLSDGREAADKLELAAAKFEENPETRGIAKMLRDRAEDLRLALAHDKQARQPER